MDMLETMVATLGGEDGIWWLAGAYFGMVILERVFAFFRSDFKYNDKDALCSIGLNLINSVFNIVVGMLLPLIVYVWVFDNFRFFTIDHLVWALLLAFIVHELSYYWEHRFSHRIGLLWAIHAIHHSSNEFNHTTAARTFFLSGLLRTPFDLPAALLGVPPIVFFAMSAMKNAFGIWNHASYIKGLGLLEHVLAPPRNHKIHHANQAHYIDKNYSQVLIIWDKLFGSFARYDVEPIVGLLKPVHDHNPLTAQFAGFAQLWERMNTAQSLGDRLQYLWRPPEWSHDGVCRSECPKYAQRPAQT
jgi:sterol desaturase/sphingolipid hydroxylase (fatty acid hydroxylase superfamily)